MDKPRLRKKNAAELRFCQVVMKELLKKVHEPYSYPFIAPVDAVALQIPDYYKIIKTPMDLGTIETKLKEQQYTSGDEFYADVKLIFKNCYKYNGVDSPVSGLAKQLEKVFDKKWTEKPEEPPEKPAKRPSSSPVREEEEEEESSSDEDEIDRIQEQMTLMAKRLSEMKQRKKQKHEKSPSTAKGKGSKGGSGTTKKRSSIGGATAAVEKAPPKPKKPKEVIPEVTFEQKRELSEKINFLSPSKMQGVLELIKDAMPLDAVLSLLCSILTFRLKRKLNWISTFFHPRLYMLFTCTLLGTPKYLLPPEVQKVLVRLARSLKRSVKSFPPMLKIVRLLSLRVCWRVSTRKVLSHFV